MNKVVHFILPVLFIMLWSSVACNQTDQEKPAKPDSSIDLDLPAMYSGLLPCADCPGVDYTLVLEESGYTGIRRYRDHSRDAFTQTGNWSLSADTLKLLKPDSTVSTMFLADRDQLVLLDQHGGQITGDLAEKTILHRTADQLSIRQHHAQLREEGIKFFATGNEPFWNIQIDPSNRIVFKTPESTQNFDITDSSKTDTIIQYISATDSTNIIVRVEDSYCQDSMSGYLFSETVTVLLQNGKSDTLKGCGLFLNR